MEDRAFVVMQVGSKDSPERRRADEVYGFVVAPALANFGITPLRADLDPTPGPITTKLISDLINCRVVIADLTGKNVNVYYELGIAHSFGRPTVAIADTVRNLPFDAKDERVIELGSYAENGLTYVQGETAQKALVASLEIVLADGYVAPSSVREAAGTQSLDQLAPSNPIAAELSQIRESVESLEELVKRQMSNGSSHDSQVMMEFIEWMVNHEKVSPDSLFELLIGDTTSPSHDHWVRRLAKTRNRTQERLAAVDPWATDEPPF